MGMFYGLNQSGEGLGYGYLYNWYAASDANFAPTDWKVPISSELDDLIDNSGGTSVSGGRLKERGTKYWDIEVISNPDTGFKAIGTGNRAGLSGEFGGIKSINRIGSSSIFSTVMQGLYIQSNTTVLNYTSGGFPKQTGVSVRLLYTGAGTPTTVTDYDGNVYDVVLIGTQRWTVQNWKCTRLNNGTSIPTVTDNTAWNGLTTLAKCAYDNDENYV